MNGGQASEQICVSLKRALPIIAFAQASGIDAGAVLRALGLPEDLDRRDGDDLLPLADYYRIQNRFSLLFGDETCHLSARQLMLGSTDFVLRNVGECGTLYDAMCVIAESYNLLHGGEYNSVERKSDSVDYVIDDADFPYAVGLDGEYCYFSIESTLVFLHCMLMTISPDVDAQSVKKLFLKRPTRDNTCRLLAYWNAPIRFGADRYRIAFDADMALAPLRPPPANQLTSNAVYQKIVEAVARPLPDGAPSGDIQARVRDALARGVVEQKAVAAQMGVSVATLRRRLQSEGVSFRSLRREVLNETAKRLLADSRSIPDVSERLGFAEFRSFNRAFKDWNGLTPKAYLRQSEEAHSG